MVASLLSKGRKIHISPWFFKKAAKEESKYHSIFPVSGMHYLITHFISFGAVSLEAILALRFVLMLSRTRTKQHIIKPTQKEQVTESCPWHSQLARGKGILPCESISTSTK